MTDWRLPGASVPMPRPRAPLVLLLSTYEAGDYARLAVECGAIGYLPKSELDADVLVAIWETCIGAGA